MKVLRVVVFAALILLVASPVASSAMPGGTPIVRPDPLLTRVAVGNTVTIALYVQDVTDLYGADVRLSFDPALLQVVDAAPATAGVQISPLSGFLKPDYVAKKKACNGSTPSDPDCTAGGLVWYAVTQVSPSLPVSGSGALASVTFRRIAAGDAKLMVIHNELVDREGRTLPSTFEPGLILGLQPRRFYLPMTIFESRAVMILSLAHPAR